MRKYKGPDPEFWLIVAVALVIVLNFTGCSNSAGTIPAPIADTIVQQCPQEQIKQCRVWGGNKFRKRYEYCGCR